MSVLTSPMSRQVRSRSAWSWPVRRSPASVDQPHGGEGDGVGPDVDADPVARPSIGSQEKPELRS